MSTPRKFSWIGMAIVLLLVSLILWLNRENLSKEALLDTAKAMPSAIFLAAFLILPMLGFPLSLFLIAAGLRFGFVGGLLSAAVCISAHHLTVFWMAHHGPRRRIQAWLKRKGHPVPSTEGKARIRWTAIFAAISGPPYAIKLYVLALTDLPLKIYAGVSVPVYLLMGSGIIAGGAAANRFNVLWIPPVIALVAAAFFIGKTLRKRMASA
jgi:uncharacterized membrane protein YdjX (TVP38/TMEM64 family)